MNKSRRVVESFNCAIEGIIESLKREKHMQIHFYITIIVILISLFLDITKIEIALISIAVALVWVAEIINTAIEAAVDMYMKEYHDLARVAKDAGAGAVFVAAVNSVIIGYLVFYNHYEVFSKAIIFRIKNSPVHASVFSIVLVVIMTVGAKAYFRRGKILKGGMPSGHSAVAFAIWGTILYITSDTYIILASFFMALLVAQTRVKAGIHNFKEVLIGAILGGGLSFLIMKIFESL